MGSKYIQPRKKGIDPGKLSPNQRMFCEYLMADPQFNGTAAARRAGYKNPGIAATKLMKSKAVRATIGKALQERITRCRLEADAVLEHLRVALYLDPLDLFEQLPNGRFLVKRLEDVPEEARRCITKLKCRNRKLKDGEETLIEVELMSKDAAMTNALKHLGLVEPAGTQVSVSVGLDLRALLERAESERNVIDGKVIERIAHDPGSDSGAAE